MRNDREYVRYNLRRPVCTFTGRSKHLQNLNGILHEKKIVVVYGIGGVGKTELAFKYFEDYQTEYDYNIMWINAVSDNDFEKCFRSLASYYLRIKTRDEHGNKREITTVIQETFNYFNLKKCLFILDNCTHERYQTYIEPCTHNHQILITSRCKWEKQYCMFLDVFTASEAVDFIVNSLNVFAKRVEYTKLEKLVKSLNYLPLALKQACAYASFYFDDPFYDEDEVAEYLKRPQSKEYLEYSLLNYCENGYDKTVWTTWDTTIQTVRQEGASETLNWMAYSDIGIPAHLLVKLCGDENAIDLLEKYALITKRGSMYCMNGLLQLVIRESLQSNEKQEMLDFITP